VEVPLRYGGCGCSALNASNDAEGPEVVKKEGDAEPPCAGVDDPARLIADEVPAEKKAGEHENPDPGPKDDGC
jgi:hypothetical protein